ncbi:MAG TPA: alkaline phosphatase family protein [Marmoricola sp.]
MNPLHRLLPRRRTSKGVAALVTAAVAATLAIVLVGGTSGCASQSANQGSDSHRPAARSTGGSGQRSGATASLASSGTHTRVTKLLVFMVENHSLGQMRAHMPFTYGLAKRYAYASDYHGVSHPSLPNYLAIAGGSTFGVTDDEYPSVHRIKGRSIFGQALRAGRTAKLYADGMPANCALTSGGNDYAVRHNPWAYFVNERRACRRFDVPASALVADAQNGTLPNAGMVVPNVVHDAHDGSLAQADAWIKHRVNIIRKGADWRSGRLAIVITADEDDGGHGNRVLTVVASRSTAHRKVVSRRLNHYSLTRLYDDVLGVPHLRHAARAASMTKAFGITVR